MRLSITSGVLAAATLVLATLPAVAQDEWCEGREPIPHNDANYSFTTESWIRERHNGFFYGRCIKVVAPTEALRNTWVGVLPKDAIARTTAPTRGGQTFLDNREDNRSADLYFGNADDMLPAVAYYAHPDEATNESEAIDMSKRDLIDQIIKEVQSVDLESIFSFAFLADPAVESSVMDMDLTFRSTFDGQVFRYILDYALLSQSPEYAEAQFSAVFASVPLTNMLQSRTDRPTIPIAVGKDSRSFEVERPVQADFAQYKMQILNAQGTVVTEMSITYLLPAQ